MHGACYGLTCRRSAPRQQRHSHLNGIICRAMKRAQIPAVKEPVGLMRQDGKRPTPQGRWSAAGRKFLAPPYYSQRAVFASPLERFFFI